MRVSPYADQLLFEDDKILRDIINSVPSCNDVRLLVALIHINPCVILGNHDFDKLKYLAMRSATALK